jgi:predicted glycosyltransferase
MDCNFSELYVTTEGRSLDEIKAERRDILWTVFEREGPDLFLVELYPFGRRAFRFELDPLLDGLAQGALPKCPVVCSLRDILVEKKDRESYEQRVLDVLNSRFQALLIHADPRLVRLEETFSRAGDIEIPVVYTGFVASGPPAGAREQTRRALNLSEGTKLIVASAGGGRVGFELLSGTLAAFRLLGGGLERRLVVFTGPFMEQERYNQLQGLAGDGATVARFTDEFPSYLAAADLSVSMAGYNTTMNILAARAPALVWPFGQNREQRMRAETLAGMGVLGILEDSDLEPRRLAECLAEALEGGRPEKLNIDLDGAKATASWLENRIGRP